MSPPSPRSIEAAYAHCQQLADSHYENFPVASVLLPRPLRQPVAVIYAFARTADDFADEGALPIEERLACLASYDQALDAVEAGQQIDDPVFIALGDVIQRFDLPISLFHDLITAFRMDVTVHRYDSFEDLHHYCRHSANPVGRLMLHLLGKPTQEELEWSDAICTSLQLINFLQDLSQDFHEMDRIYLPLKEMAAEGVNEDDIGTENNSHAVRSLIHNQVERNRNLMLKGVPLARAVGGRFGLELRLTVLGGLKVLDLIDNSNNPFSRPRLKKRDWATLLFRAMFSYPVTQRD